MIVVVVSLNESNCCPQIVARFSFVEPKKNPKSVMHAFEKGNRRLVEYKAVAMLHGHSRRRLNNSVSASDAINLKGLRQVGHTLLSLAIPGDSDPIRSPIRSAFYRAITPGFGRGRGGSRRGENRGYRCPEGFEYGGRFTDSRFSTCGMRLFDIPGIGRAIGAALAASFPRARGGESDLITGGPYPEIQRGRRPDILIPKVAKRNKSSMMANIEALITEIGGSDKRTSRLVRRDGFVLEPVVPPSVLRVIPDNRNMEGAAYVTSALSRNDFGRDELGMLSNSGVDTLIYVMPGGSTVKISKNRELSVGERRRLGRLVSSAAAKKNDTDPLSPIRYVVGEAGDYLTYEENFVGIRNPHQLVGDGKRERWVDEVFGGRRRLKPRRAPVDEIRETESFGQVNSRITTIEGAVAHINNGGSLGDLSPMVVAKLLSEPGYAKQLDGNIVRIGSRRYSLEKQKGKYSAISERFAEDLQQFLGVESLDVFPVGRGDRRKFLREIPESAIVGSKTNRYKTWDDMPMKDIAGLFVSDMLADVRDRKPESIVAVDLGDRTFAVSVANLGAGLTDLSDIQITERTKLSIGELIDGSVGSIYGEYYRKLRREQQAAMRKMIANLLQRARKFNFNQYRDRLSVTGELTEGEKIHMDVLGTILNQRIRVLSNSVALKESLDG
jgi:hypothetical protein